jgi:cytochrome c-type biogenesis protein CcmH
VSHRGLVLGPGPLAMALLAVLGAGACKRSPPPQSAPPSPPASEGGLRPLTSRDGEAALPPGHPPVGGRASGPLLPADEASNVTGTLTVAPSLQPRLAPTDVLYVIARNARTNAVVAVRREQDVRFPRSFQISAADQMMEGTTFSGPFDITARVSRTGDAIPGKGDLEGTAKGVAVGARGVSITIDSVRQ